MCNTKSNEIIVSETDVVIEDYITNESNVSLNNTDVVLLPIKNFRGEDSPLYPEGTFSVFKYISEQAQEKNFTFDLAVSDEDYKELQLHDGCLLLSTIYLADKALLPLIISILGNYIYGKYIKEDRSVEVCFIIKTESGKNKKVKFKGNPSELSSVIEEVKKLG